jgi:hypothetical protein
MVLSGIHVHLKYFVQAPTYFFFSLNPKGNKLKMVKLKTKCIVEEIQH